MEYRTFYFIISLLIPLTPSLGYPQTLSSTRTPASAPISQPINGSDTYNGVWEYLANFGQPHGYAQVGNPASNTSGLYDNAISELLLFTQFGFEIYGLANITGISVAFNMSGDPRSGESFEIYWVTLRDGNGNLLSGIGPPASAASNAIAVYNFGGDLWNTPWHPGNFSSKFGCGIAVQNDVETGDYINPRVYAVSITITYSFFTFLANIQPTSELGIAGGNQITVNGGGFLGADNVTCRFGDVDVAGLITAPDSIACSSPPALCATSVDFSVTIDGINWLDSSTPYTYTAQYPSQVCGTSSSPAPATNSQNDKASGQNIIGVAVGVPVGVVCVATLAILVFLAFRKKDGRANFVKRRLSRSLRPPDFNALMFNYSHLSCSTRYTVKVEDKHYAHMEELISLLTDEDFVLWDAIVKLTPITESDGVAKAMVYLAEAESKGIDLFKHEMELEVAQADSVDTLFRSNSFASKMFKSYSQMVGVEYLWFVLAPVVAEIARSTPEPEESMQMKEMEENQSSYASFVLTTMEMDPTKLSGKEDMNLNKLQLELNCQKLLVTLLKTTDRVPRQFHHIFHALKEAVNKKFGEGSSRIAVSAFVFLRFICAAVVTPHTYGVLHNAPGPAVQRQLVLISKVLQNLANRARFKEEFMLPLNDFIEKNRVPVEKYLDQLCVIDYLTDLKGDMPPAIPVATKWRKAAWLELYMHLHSIKEKLIANLRTTDSELAEDLADILKDEPPAREKLTSRYRFATQL